MTTTTTTDLTQLSYRMAFREWFGLRPAEADVLIGLYVARGAFVLSQALATAAGVGCAGIPEHVRNIRTAMDTEAVDSARRMGYRLTDGGMAECRAALWTMGEELRTAK